MSALELIRKAVRLAPKDAEAQALLERWHHELPYTKRLTESRHGEFVVRSDPKIPRERLRRVVKMLDQSRREIGEALATWSRQPVVVVLFTDEVFHRATGSRHWVGGPTTGGSSCPYRRVNNWSPST